jgi:hypothetical protein
MKIPTRGALRFANSTPRWVHCFVEISLFFFLIQLGKLVKEFGDQHVEFI